MNFDYGFLHTIVVPVYTGRPKTYGHIVAAASSVSHIYVTLFSTDFQEGRGGGGGYSRMRIRKTQAVVLDKFKGVVEKSSPLRYRMVEMKNGATRKPFLALSKVHVINQFRLRGSSFSRGQNF